MRICQEPVKNFQKQNNIDFKKVSHIQGLGMKITEGLQQGFTGHLSFSDMEAAEQESAKKELTLFSTIIDKSCCIF